MLVYLGAMSSNISGLAYVLLVDLKSDSKRSLIGLPYHGEHDLVLAVNVGVEDTENVLELAFLRDKERLLR
jgi:hypothetical protein